MSNYKRNHRLSQKPISLLLCAVLFAVLFTGCSTKIEQVIDNLFPPQSFSEENPAPLNEALPETALIDMAAVPQFPELPNGCEITSLTSVLNYYGYDVDKMDMANQWLPCSDGFYGANPETEYMGYPDYDGWYCYEQPIIVAANGYLRSVDSPLRAYSETGAASETLKQLLADGYPIIVWSTIDLQPPLPSTYYAWYIDGLLFTPLENTHCLVLKGYDDIRDVFLFADPLLLYDEIEQSLFMSLFESMGSRAVILQRSLFPL